MLNSKMNWAVNKLKLERAKKNLRGAGSEEDIKKEYIKLGGLVKETEEKVREGVADETEATVTEEATEEITNEEVKEDAKTTRKTSTKTSKKK